MKVFNLFPRSHNVIIRTDIEKEIRDLLKEHFVLLYGKPGSGKTYLARNIAENFNNKEPFYYECIKDSDRKNKYQITDYENFLTITLLNKTNKNRDNKNDELDRIMTADFSIDDKEHLLRKELENQNIFFIIDDFDNLKIDDRDRIFNFLKRNINFSKHSVIITSNKALNYYANAPEEIKEKTIGTIDKEEFHKICKQYIKTLDRKTKHSINKIRLKIGKKEFYNFIYEKSEGDLCLMNEILIDLKRKLLDKNTTKKRKRIRDSFESMKKNYFIDRGKVLKVLLQDLNIDNKKVLQLLSFFEKPVNYTNLFEKDNVLNCSKCNTAMTVKKFNEVIEDCNNIFFGDYIKKENDKYYIEKTLKDLLDEERNNRIYEDVYKELIEDWIDYYKDFAEKYVDENLDKYLNGTSTDENNDKKKETVLTEIDDEFDNISKVLNYCFEKKRWQDYYEISDHIWYYCELKNKDVNEYHYKRYLVAKELNDNEKIFESGLHYCNIACKKGIHTTYRVQKTFKELEEIKKNISSKRLKTKYKYTLALQYYADKDFKNANDKFSECENELAEFIEKEKDKDERDLLTKDYISSVRWHAICLLDNAKLRLDELKNEKDSSSINNKIKDLGNDIYNFIDTMDKVLNDYKEINYNRVKSSILMYKINILIFLYIEVFVKAEDIDWRRLNRKKIKVSFEALDKNVIYKDVGLTKRFEKIEREVKPYLISEVKMINSTLNDEAQKKILPILEETEMLFYEAIKKENEGQPGKVSLTAMPDLGLANNVTRMKGGFYTGLFLEWDTAVPIIPIDSTINSCGVAIYLLKKEMSVEDFKKIVTDNVVEIIKHELNYNWNFERGNHFITLGRFNDGHYCLVMHASADEYKKDIKEMALYPEPDVWYKDSIKTIYSKTNKTRYLRYLSGEVAEKFIKIALELENINHARMKEISNLLFEQYIDNEILFIPHYGMPSKNSIAIGCSWNKEKSVLLSAPGKEIYIITPNSNIYGEKWLTPHGLGVSAEISKIVYEKEFKINDCVIKDTNDVKKIKNRTIRCKDTDKAMFDKHINEVLSKCNAKIESVIQPLATLSESGFQSFVNKEI